MLSKRITFTIGIILILASNFVRAQAPGSFDIVITNGHIIDGTGSPWYSGDLGIRDGKIAAIGNLSAAPRQAHDRRSRESGRAQDSSTCSANRS